MTHIKWTGVTRPEDAAAAAALGVQTIACVFNAQSPRYVTTERAWAIRRELPPHVGFIGVFVDTPSPLVQRIVDQCQLDAAQLFGSEPRAEVDAITPYGFKAVTVRSAADLDAAVKALPRRTKDADRPALVAHLTDDCTDRWSLVAAASARHAVLLASAALTARNVPAALRAAEPWGVDLWESVEEAPGKLDRERLAAVIAAVRNWDGQGLLPTAPAT
ncbi:MAG: N-(5'-phosphoribosyl)anthranilate isomerase [Ardenticatenales bacterium]